MLVSVIIPAFNVENYIAECLDSVLHQTYKEIEIICIDDGSTDHTTSILDKYSQKHTDRIQVLRQKNSGAPAARNKGLTIAKGEYIQFLDADDILLPDKISHQVKLLKQSKTDFVAGACKWHRLNGEIVSTDNFSFNPLEDLFFSRLGDTCSNLWKKSSLDAIGGWDVNMKSSQETNLMFRLLKANAKVVYDKKSFTYLYERKNGSISSGSIQDNLIRYVLLRSEILAFSSENNLIEPKVKFKMHNAQFNSVRQLYFYDKARSVELFKLVPVGFVSNTECDASFIYKLLFFIFGFRITQSIVDSVKMPPQ